MVIMVKEEYDIKALNPRRNPYAKAVKKPITMNVSVTTIDYFKNMSEESGIPYQVLSTILYPRLAQVLKSFLKLEEYRALSISIPLSIQQIEPRYYW